MDGHALAAEVVRLAIDKGVTFSTAESCTGGLIAHLVTDVPGASDAYLGGWVVYANVRKTDDLFVPAHLIQAHGAVSEPVAAALAAGARTRARADLAVSTTGIAGPTGATEGKPVGLVWIGVASPATTRAVRSDHPGLGRSATKEAFALRALALLRDAIQSR